jgi:hypothetical protein
LLTREPRTYRVALVEHARAHERRNPIPGSILCQHPVRVVGLAVLETVLLAEGERLDQALIGRIRLDGEGEREGNDRASHTAGVNA